MGHSYFLHDSGIFPSTLNNGAKMKLVRMRNWNVVAVMEKKSQIFSDQQIIFDVHTSITTYKVRIYIHMFGLPTVKWEERLHINIYYMINVFIG